MFEKPALKPVKPIEKPEQDEDLTPQWKLELAQRRQTRKGIPDVSICQTGEQ
jgi:hypothetical protein